MALSFVIAHRGDRACAPENTLAAIRQAAAKGAKWVEFDATLTRDTAAPVVIFHDDTVGRTTNLPDVPITEVGFDELRAADAGSWFSPAFKGERVPTLKEMVALCRELGLGMNIEIKVSSNGKVDTPEPYDDALAQLTARRVLEDLSTLFPSIVIPAKAGIHVDVGAGGEMDSRFRGNDDLILLSSFSTVALLMAKERAPNLHRGYLLHRRWADEQDFRRRLRAIEPVTMNLNQELLPDFAAVDYFGRVMYEELGREPPILAYTVNELERAIKLKEMGVSAIFTDCPGDLLQQIPS